MTELNQPASVITEEETERNFGEIAYEEGDAVDTKKRNGVKKIIRWKIQLSREFMTGQLRTGHYKTSPTVMILEPGSSSNHTHWELRIYPFGDQLERVGQVNVQLVSKNNKQYLVSYSIQLLSQNGTNIGKGNNNIERVLSNNLHNYKVSIGSLQKICKKLGYSDLNNDMDMVIRCAMMIK